MNEYVEKSIRRILNEDYPTATKLVVRIEPSNFTNEEEMSWPEMRKEIRKAIELYETTEENYGPIIVHHSIYEGDFCLAEHVFYAENGIKAIMTYHFTKQYGGENGEKPVADSEAIRKIVEDAEKRQTRGLWQWEVKKCSRCGAHTVISYHTTQSKDIVDVPICPSCAASMLKESVLKSIHEVYTDDHGNLEPDWDKRKEWLPLDGRAIFYLNGPFPVDIMLKTAGYGDDTCYMAMTSFMPDTALCEMYTYPSIIDTIEAAAKFWVYSLVNLLDNGIYRDIYEKESD